MNFLRKFFKAAWIMIFKPIVMAPINVCTGKTEGDEVMAKLNRDGVVNFCVIALLIGLGFWLGPTHRYFIWGCVGFGIGMGESLNRVINVVKELDKDGEFDVGMHGLQTTFG